MTELEWTIRVLDKLRSLVRDTEIRNVRSVKWQYDTEQPNEEENAALKRLSNAGVFRVTQLSDEAPSPFVINAYSGKEVDNDIEALVTYDLVNPIGEAVIDEFNYENYSELCKRYGLDPLHEMYTGTINVNEFGTSATVTVLGESYKFGMRMNSKTSLIISYCFRHINTPVSLSDIKKIEADDDTPNKLKDIKRITDALQNTDFDKGRALAPFVRGVSTTEITLRKTIRLSKREVTAIQGKQLQIS